MQSMGFDRPEGNTSHLSAWRNKTSLGKCPDTGGTKSRRGAKVRGERAANNRTLKNNLFLPFLCYFISAVFWTQTHMYAYIHHPDTRKPPISSHFCFQSKPKQRFAVISSLLHASSNLNAIISPAKLPVASEKASKPTDSKTQFFFYSYQPCVGFILN